MPGFVPKRTQLTSWCVYCYQREQVKSRLFVVLFVRLCKDVSHTIPDLPRYQKQDLLPRPMSDSNALRGNVDVERVLL